MARLADPHVHYNGDPGVLDTLVPVLDQYHVSTVNLISPLNPSKSWLSEAARLGALGERVVPFFMLNLESGNADQVQKAFDAGFWGLKFINPRHAYDDPVYDPVISRAQELGMPCLFHTGVLMVTETTREMGCGMSLMRADTLNTIAVRYPELLVQGAHLGNPEAAVALRAAQYAPNLVWDACGGIRHMFLAEPKILYAAMHGYARAWDSVMFATDTTSGLFKPEHADGWPTQYEYMLAVWQKIFAGFPEPPSQEQLDRFFFGNAEKRLGEIRKKRGM